MKLFAFGEGTNLGSLVELFTLIRLAGKRKS